MVIATIALAAVIGQCEGGVKARWAGDIGGRVLTCKVCSANFAEVGEFMTILGRCRIPKFKHRRRLGMFLTSAAGEGSLCRRFRRNGTVLPCTPQGCPEPPLPPDCCALAVPSPPPFDVLNPLTRIEGTFTCPDESGNFLLTREELL